jgi:hypothetical protein
VRHVTKEDIDDNGCQWSSVQLQLVPIVEIARNAGAATRV